MSTTPVSTDRMSTRAFFVFSAICFALFLVAFLVACDRPPTLIATSAFTSEQPSGGVTIHLFLDDAPGTDAPDYILVETQGTVRKFGGKWDGKRRFHCSDKFTGLFYDLVVHDSYAEYSVAGLVTGGRLVRVE